VSTAVSLDDTLAGLVGAATAKALRTLELVTVADLLWHLPRRYAERGQLTDLAALRPGEQATVLARVASVDVRPMRRRRGQMMSVVVTDGREKVSLTFFSVRGPQARLAEGRVGLFAGTVEEYRGARQLVHPDLMLLDDDASDPEPGLGEHALGFADALIPVYPATRSMPSWRIAKAVATVLGPITHLDDPLPASLRASHGFPGRLESLRTAHRPDDRASLGPALGRLRFEEAFVLQTELARRRAASRALPAVPRPATAAGLLARFDDALPFPLTPAQRSVGEQISDDLSRPHPMHRLLHGDVGSGKTLVALRAMLAVVDAGGQAALLAPTEVLASQHERTLRAMLGPLGDAGMLTGDSDATRVVLLTGSSSTTQRRRALAEVAGGTAGIVVGTHALLSEQVQFSDLGLVVIDEQHRFGVEQRAVLAERTTGSHRPHVLVLTATPIPRTVAMTVFGDLDVSVLAQRPPGRAPIATHVVPAAEKPHFVERAWARVREEVAAGNRAYVVCPRIGSHDPEDAYDEEADPATTLPPSAAVLDVVDDLRAGALREIELGTLHGRLSAEQKDAAMQAFSEGSTPVLVATTVIEVGVDVPEATVMVVLDADRFGVAALHQLRGRVGRGPRASVCLLVTRAPTGSPARDRVEAVAATNDGFALADIDLQQRREGDLLGDAQSGRRSSLRLLSLRRDAEVISTARAAASDVVDADPDLFAHPALAREVERMTGDRADYLQRA
jgi:ATP-dependent DNA helicase RecG